MRIREKIIYYVGMAFVRMCLPQLKLNTAATIKNFNGIMWFLLRHGLL